MACGLTARQVVSQLEPFFRGTCFVCWVAGRPVPGNYERNGNARCLGFRSDHGCAAGRLRGGRIVRR